MAGSFTVGAIAHLLERAAELGVDVPDEVRALATTDGHCSSHPAAVWANQHPDDPGTGCCWGDVIHGPSKCTCWIPVYTDVQADPVPIRSPADLRVAPEMCGDCAFRKGSPERADPYTEEYLFGKAEEGVPFWCHQGMLKPDHWRHPDGRIVPGSPDDWKPPTIGIVPYRLDGSPGLLCHGWTQRALRARARREQQLGECA